MTAPDGRPTDWSGAAVLAGLALLMTAFPALAVALLLIWPG